MLCLVTICQHVVQFSVLMAALHNTPAVYRLTGLKRKKNPLVCAEVYIKESDSYQNISTKLTVSIWIVLKPCPPKSFLQKNSPLSIAPGPCSRQPRYQSAPLFHSSWCSRVDWAHSEKLYTSHQWARVLTENHSKIRKTSRLHLVGTAGLRQKLKPPEKFADTREIKMKNAFFWLHPLA